MAAPEQNDNGRMDPTDAVLRYWALDIAVTDTPRDRKGHDRQKYQEETPTEAEMVARFQDAGRNIGAMLRKGSGLEAVVDDDCPEAVALGGRLLPHTPFRFGRESAPQSHHGYRVEGELDLPKGFYDHEGKKVLEVLQTGYVIAPPSVYPPDEAKGRPRSERSIWAGEPFPEPATVPAQQLARGIRERVTAALILRALPEEGARYEWSLALCGFLLRDGRLDPETVERILLAEIDVASFASEEKREEARKDVPNSIKTTLRKHENNEEATGGPTVEEQTPGLVKAISKVWGWNLRELREAEAVAKAEALVERIEAEAADSEAGPEAAANLALEDTSAATFADVLELAFLRIKRRLKQALGKELNLVDFDKAIKKLREKRQAQDKADEPTHDELRDRFLAKHPGNTPTANPNGKVTKTEYGCRSMRMG